VVQWSKTYVLSSRHKLYILVIYTLFVSLAKMAYPHLWGYIFLKSVRGEVNINGGLLANQRDSALIWLPD